MSRTVRLPVTGGVSLVADVWEPNGDAGGQAGGEAGEAAGTDPGFLLVHGLASNARLWDGVAERLHALGHAVVAVDLRGHGRSDKPDGGYDFATVCEDLVCVMESLAPRPVLVGQSWGANVGLEVAYRQPEKVRAVACVDGGTIELAETFDTWEQCQAVLAPPVLTGTPRSEMEAMVRAVHPGWPESSVQATLANFETRADGTIAPWLSRDRHLRILRALWEHRPSTRYPAVEVPVLLLPAGTGDRGIEETAWTRDKRASIEAALAALPAGRAHWFAPADHDIHAQFPVQLAELLHANALDGFFG